MSESDMRQRVIRALRPLDAVSVENAAYPGTPDVNYVEGWIELKWLRAWPKRAASPVRLDHDLTTQQRIWLRRRRRAGGAAWVMLACGRTWLLFDGAVAAAILGEATREELEAAATKVWRMGLDSAEFVRILSCNQTTKPHSTSSSGGGPADHGFSSPSSQTPVT